MLLAVCETLAKSGDLGLHVLLQVLHVRHDLRGAGCREEMDAGWSFSWVYIIRAPCGEERCLAPINVPF